VHSRAGFEARHALASYQSRPENPHLHRWEVAIRVGAAELNEEGYSLDFHEVHRILRDAVAPLEGSDLNEHPEIGNPSPSAERLAEVIAGWLGQPLREIGGTLLSVSVWEGADNRVDLVLEEGVRD
jgi:6-pyruvoyl-tetrahydropterin synthase